MDDPDLELAQVILAAHPGCIIDNGDISDKVPFPIDQEACAAGFKGFDGNGGGGRTFVDPVGEPIQFLFGGFDTPVQQFESFITGLGGEIGDQSADTQGGNAGYGSGDTHYTFVLLPKVHHLCGRYLIYFSLDCEFVMYLIQAKSEIFSF